MTVISALNERGYDAAVVNYNLGPENSAGGQAEEVREAGRRVVEVRAAMTLPTIIARVLFLVPNPTLFRYSFRSLQVSGGKDLVVVGHSSGAHVGLLSVLMGGNEGDPWVSGFVGLGGVYDVCMHYDYEARRGLEQLSPMQPACGYTRERMRENGAREVWEMGRRGGVGGKESWIWCSCTGSRIPRCRSRRARWRRISSGLWTWGGGEWRRFTVSGTTRGRPSIGASEESV